MLDEWSFHVSALWRPHTANVLPIAPQLVIFPGGGGGGPGPRFSLFPVRGGSLVSCRVRDPH